jgi:hypothetical protein
MKFEVGSMKDSGVGLLVSKTTRCETGSFYGVFREGAISYRLLNSMDFRFFMDSWKVIWRFCGENEVFGTRLVADQRAGPSSAPVNRDVLFIRAFLFNFRSEAKTVFALLVFRGEKEFFQNTP